MYITDADRIYSGIRNGKFKYLGRGAGRHVFDMGDGRVVKVARNEFGYDQNKTEYALSLAYKGDLFAKVISVSEDHRLLIMQAAKWVSNLAPVLKYYNVRSTKELFDVPEVFALIRNHRLVARSSSGPETGDSSAAGQLLTTTASSGKPPAKSGGGKSSSKSGS